PAAPGNLSERRLLVDNLKDLGAGLSVGERDFLKYEEYPDREQNEQKRQELEGLIASPARLKVLICDPHDKVTHLAPGYAEDFSELFYEKSVHQVMESLALLRDTAIVIAVDHGFCEIKELKTVRGIFLDGKERE